jgi:hypothetical protein
MAEKKNNTPEARPFAELTEEAIRHLEDIGAELDTAQGDLEALEKIGLDTSRLKERIAWGKHARSVLLERFAKKQG